MVNGVLHLETAPERLVLLLLVIAQTAQRVTTAKLPQRPSQLDLALKVTIAQLVAHLPHLLQLQL